MALRPPLAWSRCVAGLPARDEVEKALLARAGVDASSQILCFETGGMPWKGHLYHLRLLGAEQSGLTEICLRFVRHRYQH